MTERTVNSFEKGMNKDVNEILMPKGQYQEAWNAVHVDNYGDMYSIMNEKGTYPIGKLPTGYQLIGHCIDGKNIIAFSINQATGCSEIGEFRPVVGSDNFSYITHLNDCNCFPDPELIPPDECDPTYNDWLIANPAYSRWKTGYKSLNFKITNQIDATSRFLFNNERRVYFTDGLNPPRYLALDKDCTDVNLYQDFYEDTKLFPSQDLPIVTYVNQTNTGQLLPGSYQFTVRYLTDDLDPLTFGWVCHPIPVVDDVLKTNRVLYDGAPFNSTFTSKAINLQISNLDFRSYTYIEVAVIYYSGAGSTPLYKTFTRQSINQSTVNVTYTGVNSEDTINLTLNEINQIPVSYATAKHLIQKDGILFLSNLTTEETLNLQSIANQIEVRYVGELVQQDPLAAGNFDDYKEEELTFNQKGYRRGEVYSLGIGFIFNDGTTSLIYHIPGNHKLVDKTNPDGFAFDSDLNFPSNVFLSTIQPLTVNPDSESYKVPPQKYSQFEGRCGTYISSRKYADTTNLGTGAYFVDDYIRHHIMPKLDWESSAEEAGFIHKVPHIYVGNIVTLGLKFMNVYSGIQAVSDLKDKIKGVFFVREPRDSSEKQSIFSQGIVQNMMLHGGIPLTDTDPCFPTYCINPIDNNFMFEPSFVFGSAGTYRLFYGNPIYSPQIGVQSLTGGLEEDQAQARRRVAFLSPETDLLLDYKIPAKSIKIAIGIFGEQPNTNGNVQSAVFNTGQDEGGYYLYNAYYTETLSTGYRIYNQNFRIVKSNAVGPTDKASTSYGPPNLDIPISFVPDWNGYNKIKFRNPRNEGFNLLEVTNNDGSFTNCFFSDPFTYPFFDPGDAATSDSGPSVFVLFQNTTVSSSNDIQVYPNNEYGTGFAGRYLYNIYENNNSQYGNLEGAYYNLISQEYRLCDIENKVYYNGDTFISWFSPKLSTLHDFGHEGGGANETSESFRFNKLDNKGALPLRAEYFFPVESGINCNYRHRPVQFDDRGNVTSFGVKYYPNSGRFESITEDPEYGVSNGYNIQYSFENTTRKYFTAGFGFEDVTQYPTRTVYSGNTLEGEKSDQYRLFKVNNYTDLPKNTGEITNQFVQNGSLFLHTERALWRTFVNEQTAIPSNNSEIFLGNGRLFNPISKEMMSIEGGHAGCVSKWASVNTPYGYIFPDLNSRKVFMLTDGLEEITEQSGMVSWFNRFLQIDNHANNPANPLSNGLVGAWDSKFKRYILVCHKGKFVNPVNPNNINLSENNFNESFTISYNLPLKNWTSFHSYKPRYLLGYTNNLIGAENNVNRSYDYPNYRYNDVYLFKHNGGEYEYIKQFNYGLYYDNYYHKLNNTEEYLYVAPFIIRFVVNENPMIQKVFDNFVIHSETMWEPDFNVIEAFFDKYVAYTRHQSTGYVDLSISRNQLSDDQVKYKSRSYNMAIDRDRIIEPDRGTLDEYTTNYIPSQEYMFRPRIKDKYMIVEFVFSNKFHILAPNYSQNYKFVLNTIMTSFRNIAR